MTLRPPNLQSRPFRVCFPSIGNNVGGSHISTLLLARNLDRRRAEPVIVLHEEGKLADYLRRLNLPYSLIRIPRYCAPPYGSLRNTLSILFNSLRIAWFIRRRGIDIVHVNDASIHFGWTLATKLAGAKLVWHQRQGVFGNSRMKARLAALADAIVCITEYTASTLPENLKARAQIVANPFEAPPGAIDRDAAKAALTNELALAPETGLVGFFGNLAGRKRPDFFLRVAAQTKAALNRPVAFLLFGERRDRSVDDLSALAREFGIADSVHFMGFRSPAEPLIAACDVLVAPAVREGLGRSLIEAMMVGTPVVAADTGGHKEIVDDGETGFLVATEDAGAFAVAVARLLDDPALAEGIADRARTVALRDYSVEHHVTEMMRIFEKSLGRTGAAAAPEQAGGSKAVGGN